MKRMLFIIALLIVAISVQAQRANRVQSITADSINGAETVYFTTPEINEPVSVVVLQALFSQIGGTSDGKVTVQGSIDNTSWATIDEVSKNDWIALFAADSAKVANNGNEFTITDTGVFTAVIDNGGPFTYYRLKCVGTSGDSTLVTPKYIFKK